MCTLTATDCLQNDAVEVCYLLIITFKLHAKLRFYFRILPHGICRFLSYQASGSFSAYKNPKRDFCGLLVELGM